jgi:hypothetical protein
MVAFKTTLITSIGTFLIGAASAMPGPVFSTKVVNSDSAFKSSKARISGAGLLDRSRGDPDAPAGYSLLGITKINGKRIAVYAFQNGAKVNDVAGQGQGFADVFDTSGHLIRRFSFRENLNSPPQITEYVFMPDAE